VSSGHKEWHLPEWLLPLRAVGHCMPLPVRKAVKRAYRWWFTRGRNINTRAYWDEVYAREGRPSDGDARDYDSLHQAILQRVPAGSRVLDVGCGTGRLALKLLDRGCEVIGLDFSQQAIEICQSQGVDARWCELPHIPSDLGPVDVAICSEVLEHLDRPELTLRAICKVVPVGGLVVVSVPAARVIDTGLEHVHLFERRDVVSLMNRIVGESHSILVPSIHGRCANRITWGCWLAWGQVRPRT
jgi:2-polyprenyl-3-methyl-5-hydroxy-6-metoxy-1,4-benzoquinol methylase